MSLVTKSIGVAKKLKHRYNDRIKAATPIYLSPVRRIEQVALNQKFCAMTFDDGPCALPPSDGKTNKPLTLHLVEVLEQFEAKGTFDIIGDTSENYPDTPGKEGSALWGGLNYDHYPDINLDDQGGANNCPELVTRILKGGHQITNHTYLHILYGKKPFVYGRRKYLGDIDLVIADLKRLDDLLNFRHHYKMKFSRPPHYVDNIEPNLNAYDALAALNYQYLAASFDGGGWLPLADYQQEVQTMINAIKQALDADPLALCGQIIFQKDGYNMARRTPVADALAQQLQILKDYGYQVITVEDLLQKAQFTDIAPDHKIYPYALKLLNNGYCPAFSDNTIKPDKPLTLGELAMMVYGQAGSEVRRIAIKSAKKHPIFGTNYSHPYSGAIELAMANDLYAKSSSFNIDQPASMDDCIYFIEGVTKQVPRLNDCSRSEFMRALAEFA